MRMAGGTPRHNALCPHCGAFERQRVAALVERSVPRLFPRWHRREYEYARSRAGPTGRENDERTPTTSDATPSSSAMSQKKIHSDMAADEVEPTSMVPEWLRSGGRGRGRGPRVPRVAYFGPHHTHERMLRLAGVEVRGLDFFAPGYKYDETTTQKADLSGESCGGGWGSADFEPEECVPLADQSVDGVIILHVLEHVLPLDPAVAGPRMSTRPMR